ncbi:MAG: VOC family protein [Anaerolineaceae bacterium]|nr:VOC family protein [Anaerolineaceae bacterium]
MKKFLKNPDQVGIVVEDLDAFLNALEELVGLDGFEVVDYPPDGIEVGTTYYGKPSDLKMRAAFKNFDSFQLEVVQPGEGESIYKDFLEEKGPGIHHIRFSDVRLDQISEALSHQGIQEIASGRGVHGDSKWTYFDTSKALQGVILEIRRPAS